MTYVLSRRPEVSIGQPPGDLILDRSNALTQGLVFSCYNAVSDMEKPPRNYVNGQTGTRSKVASFGPSVGSLAYATNSPGGVAAGVDAARRTRIMNAAKFNGTNAWAFCPLDLSPYSEITVALWMAVLSNTDSIAVEYNTNFVNQGFLLDPHYTDPGGNIGPMEGMGITASPVRIQTETIIGAPALKAMHHYIWIIHRSNVYPSTLLWIDGAAAIPAAAGTPGPNVPFAANAGINFGARNKGASAFGNVAIACFQIWGRSLTDEEATDYYRNTWAIFRPAVIAIGDEQ